MKKIVVLFSILIFSSSQVMSYDDDFKKGFYDGYSNTYFTSLENYLLTQYPKTKVQPYIAALKGRFSRQELETKTWSCVSALPNNQLVNEQGLKCMSLWVNPFMEKNKDLQYMLK